MQPVLGEQLVYLFLGGVEREVADIKGRRGLKD